MSVCILRTLLSGLSDRRHFLQLHFHVPFLAPILAGVIALAAPATASAQDKAPAPGVNPKQGGVWDDSTRPIGSSGIAGKKSGVFDDSTKPKLKNDKSGVFDDGVKPAASGADPRKGGIFDDSTKPADPKVDPKQGGVIDDSTRPKPGKP